jgi:RimJ/RimL family protein N-acetyltransferase
MPQDIGNYARHARYWDWGGHDRTGEHEYWLTYAVRYGKNVLIPMCAIGETGAYLAKCGFSVTAFDVTPEMVAEGKKRFSGIPGLRLYEGDVRDFRFDIPPVDFCFSMDFGHILTIEDVKKALTCIGSHLRDGGCLVVETDLRTPGGESDYIPAETFYPLKQIYPNRKVWKTGDTRTDAETGRCYISQTFFTEDENGHTESFDHSFYLQSYTREEWLGAFKECGFDIVSVHDKDGRRLFETVKKASVITSHDVTLYGKTGEYDITLRPLCDEHLPLLYKWNADPEVVYWADTGNADVFDEKSVREIYGNVSENAFCFLAEANSIPIGDFWLQKMNIPEVSALYPGLDVRRIEACIGEKSFWGKGIGSAVLGMLIDFAFRVEHVDVLHCFAADYNHRSQKMLLKLGFRPCGENDAGEESLRAKIEYHYRLTKQKYIG